MTTRVKSLRSRTIIPDALYVDREADRQLSAVVDDMGRPGYILVARQMGKTNLLLRMKRQQEAQGSTVLYFDLSTGFESARDLFRHIIDAFVEITNAENVRQKIANDRAAEQLDVGAEYDRHLRLLLLENPARRVVLVFDEIDSLVGKNFSDRILSQIRSMYFARVNYSVYENLTYVLSGVAEPTDLIKDKNISPFNIGEKIYLNDFTRSEVALLLRKADLLFPHDVQEAVFAWANGNPRMTWDICSALEDVMISGEIVTAQTVSTVVKKLYFERFDRPPVDHIRALAENDKDVRNSLVALLYGKGASLDDRAKSKLYLAGITTASANESPKIKNKIIEESLSESWLAQVHEGRQGLVDAAGRRFQASDNAGALELYQQYLNEGGDLTTLDDLDIFNYALVQYNLGLFPTAIDSIILAISRSRSPEVRLRLKYYLGICYLLSGQGDKAVASLETVASTDNPFRTRAMHALGSTYILTLGTEGTEKTLNLMSDVIARLDAMMQVDDPMAREEEEIEELRAASHYNMGQALQAADRADEARVQFGLAYQSASLDKKPAFASYHLAYIIDDSEKVAVLTEVTKILEDRDIPYRESAAEITFTEKSMAGLLANAHSVGERRTINALLDIATKRSTTTRYETLRTLIDVSLSAEPKSITADLLKLLTLNPDILKELSPYQKLEAARRRDELSQDDDAEQSYQNYWKVVVDPQTLPFVGQKDLIRLSNRMRDTIARGKFAEAKTIVSFVRKHKEELSSGDDALLAFFVYHEMVVHRMESDAVKASNAAAEILRLLPSDRSNMNASAHIYGNLIESLRSAAQDFVNSSSTRSATFKRNDYVNYRDSRTGLTHRTKFKKIADLVENGKVEIVPD